VGKERHEYGSVAVQFVSVLTKDSDYSKLYLKIQFVPRRKHCDWIIRTNKLLLYVKIIAVFFSEIHTEHINAACRQHADLLCAFAKYEKQPLSSYMSVCPPELLGSHCTDFHEI